MNLDKIENCWPPVYSIKRSKRASRVNLKISARHGLELILPTRFKIQEIPSILNEKRKWIETHLEKFRLKGHEICPQMLPEQFMLKSCAQLWKIQYVPVQSQTQIIVQPQNVITLLGPLENKIICKQALVIWLKEKAWQILTPILQALSSELSMPFKKVMIRNQKTRWGSCSSRGTISLNYKLIFLAPELVRHILIHELCHTVHMEHSPQFWQLVAQYDKNWQEHRLLTRKSDQSVPLWLEE